MTQYLLDTNAVIAILKGNPTKVRQRFRSATEEDATILVSSVVMFELWYGVARSQRRAENSERLRIFLSGAITVSPFDDEDARIAGDLRAQLERTGQPIGPYDLLIAAQSLRSKATLVTANVDEFGRVDGLDWQDWASTADGS